jgi:16S rRNA (guanine527-N7)-methyltransferase
MLSFSFFFVSAFIFALFAALRFNFLFMREEFIESVKKHQSAFDLNISNEKIEKLADYYDLIQKHNEHLHLIAPSSAEEFAVRHVLESLTLLDFLPQNARFADVGTGGGLPSIPCLVAREDLRGVLIESKEKKVNFLKKAAEELNVSDRVQIINKQFEEAEKNVFSFVTCRALDKFTEKLPRILKWSGGAKLLFFGGNNLAEALKKQKINFEQKLMPLSEQRFLFIAENLQKTQ